MKNTHLILPLLAIPLWLSPVIASSQTRCPAGDSGCTMETAPSEIRNHVIDGAHDVWKNPNGNGRVKEVKETLQDCMNCGLDAVKDGFNRVSGQGVR